LEELWKYAALFGVGAFAGFVNIMAGGGSTLTLPALIFLGLDGPTANGTNRVAILIQNISAVASFRSEKFSSFKLGFKMAAFTLPGAIAGALFAAVIPDDLFRVILAFVLVGVAITMLIPKRKTPTTEFGAETDPPWTLYLALFGVGFYGGFIQVGVGFILMLALHGLLKVSLARVNMHKVFIVLVYTIPALVVFVVADLVRWDFGLTMAAGNAGGAWLSAKLAVRKGDKIVKWFVAAAVVVVSLKLIGAF
jgi:hypothetical protein